MEEASKGRAFVEELPGENVSVEEVSEERASAKKLPGENVPLENVIWENIPVEKIPAGRTGFLIILSGFSGAGKGTVIKELLAHWPEEYVLSISATTRKPRGQEREGVEYYFKTREEFQRMIEENRLLEHAEYVGNYYGTPAAPVEKNLAAGRNVLLEIEIQGAMKIKEKYPETLMLFLTPPTAGELARRLGGRGTEGTEVIEARMKRALEEAEGCENYDYLIINDDLKTCAEEIHTIVRAERSRMKLRLSELEEIRKELRQYLKGE